MSLILFVNVKSKKQVRKKGRKFIDYDSMSFMSLIIGLILIVIGLVFDFNRLLTALFIGIGGLLILIWKIRTYWFSV